MQEAGFRQIRHPLAMDGRVSPEPRMVAGDLGSRPADEREQVCLSLVICSRRGIACRNRNSPGLDYGSRESIQANYLVNLEIT
ncbi:hypothetical protein [Desulfosporosinus metallidurans]|uniref:hypothetical protein n=1 Tax=Desulfosporosinus metallidurans TaxID=1888891 RepID=UPI000A45B581|nr:hypothetical protein [Desulfosporosinus metallidurans]